MDAFFHFTFYKTCLSMISSFCLTSGSAFLLNMSYKDLICLDKLIHFHSLVLVHIKLPVQLFFAGCTLHVNTTSIMGSIGFGSSLDVQYF